MKADEIFSEIKNMDNGERVRLLGLMFYEYYDIRPPHLIAEGEREAVLSGDDNWV